MPVLPERRQAVQIGSAPGLREAAIGRGRDCRAEIGIIRRVDPKHRRYGLSAERGKRARQLAYV